MGQILIVVNGQILKIIQPYTACDATIKVDGTIFRHQPLLVTFKLDLLPLKISSDGDLLLYHSLAFGPADLSSNPGEVCSFSKKDV